MSMPRLAILSFRISSICFSWNSAGALMVTVSILELERGAGVLEIEALGELAARLIDGVGQFMGVDFGDYVERHGIRVVNDTRAPAT